MPSSAAWPLPSKNISGGSVGSTFIFSPLAGDQFDATLRQRGEHQRRQRSVGDNADATHEDSGSVVNISGGSVGSFFNALFGSEVR